MSELQEKRVAASRVKEERKVKFAAEKAKELEKLKQEATLKFEEQRREQEARENAAAACRLLREQEAKALAIKEEEESRHKLHCIRLNKVRERQQQKEEETLRIETFKKEQEQRIIDGLKALEEAKKAEEAERISKLWIEVYSSRAFKHATHGAKALISKEHPDGLLDRLKDIQFLNRLELESRAKNSKTTVE